MRVFPCDGRPRSRLDSLGGSAVDFFFMRTKIIDVSIYMRIISRNQELWQKTASLPHSASWFSSPSLTAWGSCKAILIGLCGKGILRHVHRKNILRDSKAHFILAFNRKPKA